MQPSPFKSKEHLKQLHEVQMSCCIWNAADNGLGGECYHKELLQISLDMNQFGHAPVRACTSRTICRGHDVRPRLACHGWSPFCILSSWCKWELICNTEMTYLCKAAAGLPPARERMPSCSQNAAFKSIPPALSAASCACPGLEHTPTAFMYSST